MKETKKRDYKAEYKKYGSSKKAKKYRAELNKYNRRKGTYGNGDGKDASHKGGKIVGFEEQSKNRGRREKSRLKKESSDEYGKSLEKIANDKKLKSISKKDRDTLKKLAKLLKKEETTITVEELKRLVKEELLDITESHHDKREGKMAKYDAKEIAQDAADVFKMIDNNDDLPEWLEAKITIAAHNMNTVKDYLTHHQSKKVDEDIGFTPDPDVGKNHYVAPKRDTKGGMKTFYQKFSSPEAKTIIDGSLKKYSKILRKAQYEIIKDWMKAAKAGVIDYFDLIRGFNTGDVRRAHPNEVEFLNSILAKDKIVNRFRSYFGGKKGKKRR